MRERLRLLNGTLVTGPQDRHRVVAAGLPLAAPSPSAPPADATAAGTSQAVPVLAS
jgi:hypothetical protein